MNIPWKYISQKGFVGLSLAMAGFPILSFGLRSVVLALWALFGILFYWNRSRSTSGNSRESTRKVILCSLPFLALLMSLSYSSDVSLGIQKIIQMSPMLIIPVILGLNRSIISKQAATPVLTVFVASVLCLVVVEIGFSVSNWDILSSAPTPEELKVNQLKDIEGISSAQERLIRLRRFRNLIDDFSGSHPTYQAIWCCFAIFIVVFRGFKTKNIAERMALGLAFVLLLTWTILLSSRMPVAAAILAGLGTVFLSRIPKTRKLILLGTILFATSITYWASEDIRVRVNEVLLTGLKVPKADTGVDSFNSTNVRNGIYYCCKEILAKQPFTGVGIGDLQAELNRCYQDKIGAKIYGWRDYNSHNQYLFFWGSAGLAGLITLLLALGAPLAQAIKQKNLIYVFFLIQVSLVLLSENVISRSDGILFYSFFNSLFFLGDTSLYNNYREQSMEEGTRGL